MAAQWLKHELEDLVVFLRIMPSASLSVVVSEDPALREQAMDHVRQSVSRPFHVLSLSEKDDSVLQLIWKAGAKAGDVVCVSNLQAGGERVLREIDYGRETIADSGFHLVLWVSLAERLSLLQKAPNLYSRRSILLQLFTPPLILLHLSDLQFGQNHRYPNGKDSYQTLFGKLADDLDLLAEKYRTKPNAIVITGDIAEKSLPEEYGQARDFLESLSAKTDIPRDRIVLIPGNHDVNWDLCEGARHQARGRNLPFHEPYFPKFENYVEFFNSFYGGSRLFDLSNLYHVYRFDEEKVLVAGFNSCIKESELGEDHYGWIGVEQVKRIQERCDEIDPQKEFLRIAAMHHNFSAGSNLDQENLRDADAIRPALAAAGFSMILHGHRHIADIEMRKRAQARLPLTILGAGSAGLDAKALPDHPNQYQVIRIENRSELIVFMRQYSAKSFGASGEGRWTADPSIEEMGGSVRMSLGHAITPAKPAETRAEETPAPSFPAARDRFLSYVREDCRYLPLRGFGTDIRVPIELEPVYVPLRTVPSHFELEKGREMPPPTDRPQEMDIGTALRFAKTNRYCGLVVLGDPGSGKTTLLRYVALCLAESKPPPRTGIQPGRLPLLLPFRYVKDFRASLADALRARHASLDLPADFFRRALESGNCLILLDGLDEVASPERRKEALNWVEEIRKSHAGNPIVVSSRFAGYIGPDRLPEQFLELNLRDFRDEDIEHFAREWYCQVETRLRGDTDRWREEARRLSEDLLANLRKYPNLKDLAKNPLMLQILCLVHRSQGAMPKRKTELYEECIKVLLQKWDEAKGLEVYLSAAEARQVLRPLALWLHSEEGRTYADKEQVKEVILPPLRRVKKDPGAAEQQLERILTSVRDRSGLFVGYDVTRYGFQHLSFQEFLAADEIAKQGLHEKLVETFGRSWWKEPTLLALGLDDPRFQAAFFDALLRSDVFRDNLPLALDCVREALAPDVKPFLRALKDRKLHPKNRTNCALLLREIGGPEAIQALETPMEELPGEIAKAVRDALVQLGALKPEGPGTRINEKDGTELIRIPAGEFIMGSDRGREDERPQRRVYLDEYFIAKHPVTNAQYRRFVEETGHKPPYYWDDKRFNKPNQPVVGVSWSDAKTYSEWAGLRLPTEAEWEKAARGTDGREFPWGDDPPTEKRCNYAQKVGATTEIGSYPDGVSPYGCHDMAGNVREWCQDWYGPYDRKMTKNPKGPGKGDYRVLRGGCWANDALVVRCAYRYWLDPVDWIYFYPGFRCAR